MAHNSRQMLSGPMSALGQKQTFAAQKVMSALPLTATESGHCANGQICFTPDSGRLRGTPSCLLWAKSGHRTASFRTVRAGSLDAGTFNVECLGGRRPTISSNPSTRPLTMVRSPAASRRRVCEQIDTGRGDKHPRGWHRT